MCVHTFKHEYFLGQLADCNQILSEASFGFVKGCSRFRLDNSRTLVSMATDSCHRFIIGKNGVATFSRLFLI